MVPVPLTSTHGICQVQFEHIKQQRSWLWSPARLVTRTCIVLTVVAPLAEQIKSIAVHYHQNADDTQLYIAIRKNNMHTECKTLQQCTFDVQQWLMHNGLLSNSTKSDAVQITLGKGRSVIEEFSTVCVSGAAIQPSKSVKSSGVTLNKHLSFDEQVNNVANPRIFICVLYVISVNRYQMTSPKR